jgi:hypothetical protein
MRWNIWVVLLATTTLATDAFAERAPEDCRHATHVVVGKVQGVYVRKTDGALHYVVEIGIEKTEKGNGLKVGEMFYVRCYQWDPDWLKGKKLSAEEQKRLAFRGAAYDSIPKEGERVKVYAKHGGGYFAGIYPNWYEVIKEQVKPRGDR